MSLDRSRQVVDTLLELGRSDDFLIGLAVGVMVLALLWITQPDRSRPPMRILGLVLTFGTLVGWHFAGELNQPLLGGIVLVIGGAATARLVESGGVVTAAATVPGSLAIALYAGVAEIGWIRAAIVIGIPLAGLGIVESARVLDGHHVLPALLAITFMGATFTLAEPERALLLSAVSIPLIFAGWPRTLARIGAPGAYGVAAVFAAAITIRNDARPGGIVGAAACLGLLALIPLAQSMLRSRRGRRTIAQWPGYAIVAYHTILVYGMSRIAGLRDDALAALALASAFAIAGSVVPMVFQDGGAGAVTADEDGG